MSDALIFYNPGKPVPEERNIMGLTDREDAVMNSLVQAVRDYSVLEEQHPDEMRTFIDAIHVIQGLLAERVVRRSYPKGWPSSRKEKQKYADVIEES